MEGRNGHRLRAGANAVDSSSRRIPASVSRSADLADTMRCLVRDHRSIVPVHPLGDAAYPHGCDSGVLVVSVWTWSHDLAAHFSTDRSGGNDSVFVLCDLADVPGKRIPAERSGQHESISRT